MPRITPVHHRVLECIFKKLGFEKTRHNSTSHMAYTKKGCLRPLMIPTYDEIAVQIISGLIRTSGITREKYFELLAQCK